MKFLSDMEVCERFIYLTTLLAGVVEYSNGSSAEG